MRTSSILSLLAFIIALGQPKVSDAYGRKAKPSKELQQLIDLEAEIQPHVDRAAQPIEAAIAQTREIISRIEELPNRYTLDPEEFKDIVVTLFRGDELELPETLDISIREDIQRLHIDFIRYRETFRTAPAAFAGLKDYLKRAVVLSPALATKIDSQAKLVEMNPMSTRKDKRVAKNERNQAKKLNKKIAKRIGKLGTQLGRLTGQAGVALAKLLSAAARVGVTNAESLLKTPAKVIEQTTAAAVGAANDVGRSAVDHTQTMADGVEDATMNASIELEKAMQQGRMAAESAADDVQKQASKSIRAAGQTIDTAERTIVNSAETVADGARDTANQIGQTARGSAKSILNQTERLEKNASESANAFVERAEGATQQIQSETKTKINRAQDQMNAAGDRVMNTAKGTASHVERIGRRVGADVKDQLDATGRRVDATVRDSGERVERAVSGAQNSLRDGIQSVHDSAHRRIDDSTKAIENSANRGRRAIGETTQNAAQNADKMARGAVKTVGGAVRRTAEGVDQSVRAGANSTHNVVTRSIRDAESKGRESAVRVNESVRSTAENVEASARDASLSVENSMRAGARSVGARAERTADAAKEQASNVIESSESGARQAGAKVADSVAGAQEAVNRAADGIADTARSASRGRATVEKGARDAGQTMEGAANEVGKETRKKRKKILGDEVDDVDALNAEAEAAVSEIEADIEAMMDDAMPED